MYGFLLILHCSSASRLVAVVLIQSGKGGGLAGGAFGGSAQTVFGGRGATDFLTRATMVLGGAVLRHVAGAGADLDAGGTSTGTRRA